MLTSRRALLKIFVAATTVGSTAPAALALTSGDRYWNQRLKLELQKPPGWHFWSTVDFQVAASQQILRDDTPVEVEEILRKPEAAPFLVIASKHPKAGGVSSAVCAYDEFRDQTYPTATECMDEALEAYSRFLPGVSTRGNAAETEVPGAIEAATALWGFDFELADGSVNPVSVLTLLSYRPGRMQTTHFMALGEQAEQDTYALQDCRATLRYRDA